jgi:hypothetical protein
MLVCEECEREFYPAEENQRWCTIYCVRRWHKKKNETPPEVVVKRACPVCWALFVPRNVRSVFCSQHCQMKDYRSTLSINVGYTLYDTWELLHKLPCFRCQLWVVNAESENGGYCTSGMWRVCKPYMPGAKPYKPKEK